MNFLYKFIIRTLSVTISPPDSPWSSPHPPRVPLPPDWFVPVLCHLQHVHSRPFVSLRTTFKFPPVAPTLIHSHIPIHVYPHPSIILLAPSPQFLVEISSVIHTYHVGVWPCLSLCMSFVVPLPRSPSPLFLYSSTPSNTHTWPFLII